MFVTAFLALSYIHYKSPHYDIILDKDMIIIPKYTLIPDSYYIKYSDIIFYGEFNENDATFCKIVYNGGSVIIKKNYLRSPEQLNEIVYYLKEVTA